MTLSLHHAFPCPFAIDILLCEVPDEDTAFAEMRRFLYVNDIRSNITRVKVVEEHESYPGKIVPAHKEVLMYARGFENDDKDRYRVTDVGFKLYYNSRPEREQLGTLEDWGLHREFDHKTGKICLVYNQDEIY